MKISNIKIQILVRLVRERKMSDKQPPVKFLLASFQEVFKKLAKVDPKLRVVEGAYQKLISIGCKKILDSST